MERIIKKMAFVLFLLSINLSVFAPANQVLTVFRYYPEEPFRRLINAIGIVETGSDTLAFNMLEDATGFFQIRPIRLQDYNQRTGNSYSMSDLYDYHVSEKIFLYYASKKGPYDFESIARSWNGSGAITMEYWKKVKEYL